MAGKFSWDEYFAHTNPGCNAGSSPNVADAIRRNAGPADAAEGAPPAEEAPQPRNGPSLGEDATRTPGKKPYMLHAGLAHSEVVPELPRAPRKPAFVIQVPASVAPEPVQETPAPTAETPRAPENAIQDIFAAEQEVETVEPVLSSEAVEAALSTWAELAGIDPRAEARESVEGDDDEQEEPELEVEAPEPLAASEDGPDEEPENEPELEPVTEELVETAEPAADVEEPKVYELEPIEGSAAQEIEVSEPVAEAEVVVENVAEQEVAIEAEADEQATIVAEVETEADAELAPVAEAEVVVENVAEQEVAIESEADEQATIVAEVEAEPNAEVAPEPELELAAAAQAESEPTAEAEIEQPTAELESNEVVSMQSLIEEAEALAPERVADAVAEAEERFSQVYELAQTASLDEALTQAAASLETTADPDRETIEQILKSALRAGASSVYFQPTVEDVEVRHRVDGDVQTVQSLQTINYQGVLAHLRTLAGMECDQQNDGQFSISLEDHMVAVKLTTHPTVFGPRVTLHVYEKAAGPRPLEDLGLDDHNLSLLRGMIHQPHGLVLVAGPAESGRTTTLYSALQELSHSGRNVLTCEYLVECAIDGVGHSEVGPAAGVDLATQLRSTLAQEPDVIMVGEIRDRATAELAIGAALEGCLVMSSMTAPDAGGAIARLIELGVDPFLLSACLVGVTGQRLVKALCRQCAAKAPGSDDQRLLSAVLGSSFAPIIYKAVGCPECLGSGFRGRIPVHEVLPISPRVASLIAGRASVSQMREAAVDCGYRPLQVDVVRHVIAGETTLAEATRLVSFEGPVAPEILKVA